MSRCNLNLKNSKAAGGCFILLGIIFSQATPAFACGSNFPNEMLDRGDDAVLAAPIADFNRELERIHLLPANFTAVLTTNDYASQTTDADLADLRAALRKTELSKAERERIISDYQTARIQLSNVHGRSAKVDDGVYTTESVSQMPPADPVPSAPPSVLVPAGLPDEFADYFRGSIAWHADHTNVARTVWESLLQRPAAERHYRSTWAAYMLGKYWQGVDEEKAVGYFQKVRTLAAVGFADRLGLAAASLGWEAHEELHRKNFDRAIQLYLQQLAAGDNSAISSLRTAAGQALGNGGGQLALLATNAECRRVITAYITSRKSFESLFDDYHEGVTEANRSIVVQWLKAVEAAEVNDLELAEQLALAAYQAGEWKLAQRWIQRAKTTPVTDWLQAKLLLRSGKIDAAAALLEKVARYFPVDESVTNQPEVAELKDNLYLPGFTYVSQDINPSVQVLAEIGVLRLARREYTQSLDALLRSGFWMDAAYVAERVLTLDELKSYVDRNWPATNSVVNVSTNADLPLPRGLDLRREVRYLLARRLTRSERGNEAREYYPTKLQFDYDVLVQNLLIEGNGNSSSGQRSAALVAAANLVRERGLELIGTEVEPDWQIHGGRFEEGVSISSRGTNDTAHLLGASDDETQRAQRHGVIPDERFHYRYQAAALAWEAAALMPNNSEETARVLCLAGSWLKSRDPKSADVFYKSLVRRCRKTEIGKLADRMHWFPDLDANGNPVAWEPEPPREVEADSTDTPGESSERSGGFWFVLNRGNMLQDVVTVVRATHQITVTSQEIQLANPAINPNRLKAGLMILVPVQLPDNTRKPGDETPFTVPDNH